MVCVGSTSIGANAGEVLGATAAVVGVWSDELDDRMATWKARYPDVQIHPVATRGSLGQFLAGRTDETLQLAVLGQNDVDEIAFLVWPQNQPADRHRECSVLVVR